MAGKVWLVGAGPSDGGLLTLKGKAVLEQAEVVVFDALVGPEILAWIPPQAEKIDVGKRAGCHLKSQEEINRILLEKALEGRRVVRLKGGDPFLFGRGGEELELLTACGVAYEVVPGVTSAVAVPAYCGIPVTHRDFCSSVHIITGHERQGKRLGASLPGFGGDRGNPGVPHGSHGPAGDLPGTSGGGTPSETPAAVLEKGATAEQRTLVADLETLPRRTAEAGMQTPAIIVVGGVCACGEKFAWREKLPLFGCRAVVTRPRGAGRNPGGPAPDPGGGGAGGPGDRNCGLERGPRLGGVSHAAGGVILAGLYQRPGRGAVSGEARGPPAGTSGPCTGRASRPLGRVQRQNSENMACLPS